jgi:hypothetical protein
MATRPLSRLAPFRSVSMLSPLRSVAPRTTDPSSRVVVVAPEAAAAVPTRLLVVPSRVAAEVVRREAVVVLPHLAVAEVPKPPKRFLQPRAETTDAIRPSSVKYDAICPPFEKVLSQRWSDLETDSKGLTRCSKLHTFVTNA